MDDIFSDPGIDDEGAGVRPDHRRSTPRDSMFLQATLRRVGDETPLTMRIRNLSAGGMMAEIGEPFAKGDHIEIDMRGIGELLGTVMWRAGNRIGIAFAAPIDPRLARKSIGLRPAVAATPVAAARTTRRPKLFGE